MDDSVLPSAAAPFDQSAFLAQNLTIVAMSVVGAWAVFYVLTVALAFSHRTPDPFAPRDAGVYVMFGLIGALAAVAVVVLALTTA